MTSLSITATCNIFFVFLCNNCQSLAWLAGLNQEKKVLIAAFDFNPIFAVNN